MQVVTWNCNGALRKKFKSLAPLNADIHVIQECENPASTNEKEYRDWASNYLWIGGSKNKGLGVFVRNEVDLKKLDWPDSYDGYKVKYFLPCKVGHCDFLAVWTHKNQSPNFGYVGQLWKYLQINRERLKECIIIGDFNSNAIWDEWDRWWNHSDVVRELREIGIESFYHAFSGEKQGCETRHTLYMYRNKGKAYHIDYCFGPKIFEKKIKNITIEDFEKWKHLSDHVPMIVEINDWELPDEPPARFP